MRAKLPRVLVALVLLTSVLAACGSSSDTASSAGGSTIVVGSFGFSESEVLAQVYGTALKNAGAAVEYRLNLGNREVVAPALEKGEIDMVPEYLGNFLSFLDRSGTRALSTEEALRAVQAAAAAKGLTVAEASAAEDADVIAVTKELADQHGLKAISDLKKLAAPITLAGPSECATRETCLLGLRSTYGLDVAFTSTGDEAGGPLTKQALHEKRAQIGRLFSSDPDTGRGGQYVVLEDDKDFQQPGNVLPVLRTTKVTPALLAVLNGVSRALTTEKLAEMNERTGQDMEDPAAVAAEFVATEKL